MRNLLISLVLAFTSTSFATAAKTTVSVAMNSAYTVINPAEVSVTFDIIETELFPADSVYKPGIDEKIRVNITAPQQERPLFVFSIPHLSL